jgi:SanA protein
LAAVHLLQVEQHSETVRRRQAPRAIRLAWRLILISGLVVAAVFSVPRLYAALRYEGEIHNGQEADAARIGIVFGAGLSADGTPSLILQDRMATAVELYRAGKVQKLLLSGDNRFVNYNEPQSMYESGVRMGLPPEAMVRDYAGRRTYDTCRRARDIFKVTQALLITQRYHLDRALLTCDTLGLDVQGVPADRSPYPRDPFISWWLRELPATTQALWDLYIAPPDNVVLGDPIPI